MGNWKLTRSQEPQALTEPVLREMRKGKTGGLTRRQLIRRSIGAAVALWLLEVGAGTLGFLWPNLARGFGGTALFLASYVIGGVRVVVIRVAARVDLVVQREVQGEQDLLDLERAFGHSLMPGYDTVLTGAEIDNLASYLMSLKGAWHVDQQGNAQ